MQQDLAAELAYLPVFQRKAILFGHVRRDFPRLRVGVGKKPEGWELADWVLSHYQTEADRKTQFDAFLRAADVVDDLMKNGLESAMRMANAPA